MVVCEVRKIPSGRLGTDKEVGKHWVFALLRAILPESDSSPPSRIEIEVDALEDLQVLINAFPGSGSGSQFRVGNRAGRQRIRPA